MGSTYLSNLVRENCYLWSFKEDRLLATIPAQKDFIRRTAAFSGNSKILALTKGVNILLYDVEKGILIGDLKSDLSNIIHISFSPDGKYLVSADNTESWALWDIERQKIIQQKSEGEPVNALKFGSDSQSFALASGDVIYQYSLKGEELGGNGTDYSTVDDIQYSKDGKHIAVLLDYGAILLYSADFKEKKKITNRISTEEISFSKDGNYLWTNGYYGTFKINLEGDEIFAVPYTSKFNYNIISLP